MRSKYDVLISAAGGVDLREARSAIFNGANIVVVNIVSPYSPWRGIKSNENVAEIAKEFLVTPQAIFYAFKRLKITRKKRQRSTKKGMKKRGEYFWKL